MHRALTVCQPWAWAILRGIKAFENRTWATTYRGPLLIHVGKSQDWMRGGMQWLRDLGIPVPMPSELAFGALVGQVELAGCYARNQVPLDLLDFSAEGPFCWHVTKPRRILIPVPYRGQQGIFGVPDRVLRGARWEPACRVCGCTEYNPCEEGCSWVEPDLCSACAEG